MAVKCMIILTIISFLGAVCARELKLTSKIKADPGIFISLETLRRLEEGIKNKKSESNAITDTTPVVDLDNVDSNDISTTSTPDHENNPVADDSNEEDNVTISSDLENQTSEHVNPNDATTDENADKPETPNPSTPNPSETTKKPNSNEQTMQWPFPQYVYSPYPMSNLFQQISLGTLPNQQNLGFYQINPLSFNEQLFSNKNSPQPLLVNPQAPMDLNKDGQPTFVLQNRYPMFNQVINPQIKFMPLNPVPVPFPYSQMFQPIVKN